ncbi:hypothetical protein P8452_16947 [Trifolium repens]|nr:hypothetical protein P8452_16947 [Trifolium repens]
MEEMRTLGGGGRNRTVDGGGGRNLRLTYDDGGAYHVSINTLTTIVEKLQKSATPFIKELILALKIQFLNFISNLKPHFDFLTSKTSEAYHVSIDTLTTIVENLQSLSINTLVTIVENLQRSATQFIKELYKSALPYIMKMSMWLLSELMKGIDALFQFNLEAAR